MRKINHLYRGALRVSVDKPVRAIVHAIGHFQKLKLSCKSPHLLLMMSSLVALQMKWHFARRATAKAHAGSKSNSNLQIRDSFSNLSLQTQGANP